MLPLPPDGTIVVMAEPEHTVCVAGDPDTATVLGLTATVEVTDVPVQPFKFGVMVNVTVVVVEPLRFVNTPVIFPLPLDDIPFTDVVLFLDQLKTVPGKLPLAVMGVIFEPEQID